MPDINSNKKILFRNALSLYLIKGINMLFPIILIPLIIKKLGLSYYGVYAIIISVTNLLVVVLDFGFSYTGTNMIARIKDDAKKISEYFSIVFFSQLYMLLAAFAILFILSFQKNFQGYGTYFILCVPMLVGYVLNPGWLFQGFEVSHINAIINILFRTFTIVILYLFLNKHNGLSFLFLVYSIGFFGWGLAGLLIAIKKYKIKVVYLPFSKAFPTIKKASNIFFATFISSIYLMGIPMILNFFNFNIDSIASYSIAERIIRGICSFISPLSVALLPYFVSGPAVEKKLVIKRYLTIALKISLPFLFISALFFFGLPLAVKLIRALKSGFSLNRATIDNIRIQSFIIFFSVFNSIIGITSFISLGYEVAFRRIMMTALLLSAIIFIVLIQMSNQYVGSITVLFTEIALSIFFTAFLGFKFFRRSKYEQ
jgi:PST family polysaccharide transporter